MVELQFSQITNYNTSYWCAFLIVKNFNGKNVDELDTLTGLPLDEQFNFVVKYNQWMS